MISGRMLRDCAIIIRRGGPKTRRGALHKIATKIGGGGGAQSKITHLAEGGGGLKFYSKFK